MHDEERLAGGVGLGDVPKDAERQRGEGQCARRQVSGMPMKSHFEATHRDDLAQEEKGAHGQRDIERELADHRRHVDRPRDQRDRDVLDRQRD